nr:unnamed protein product [Digitaria exilis]
MGTPSQTLSNVEFHPQCVQNAPTAACANTSLCGAHATTFPLLSVSSMNPSGNGGGGASPEPVTTKPGRTTHRNGTPLPASPHAISSNTSRSTVATLPRLTYSTDRGGRASSHARQLRSAAGSGDGDGEEERRCSGPTAKAGASIPSNVLTSTPDDDSRAASVTPVMKPASVSASLPSTRIRSRARSGSWSGEQGEERGGAVGSERERGEAEVAGGAERRVALPVDDRARDVVVSAQQRGEGLAEGRLAGGVEGEELPGDVGDGGGDLLGERLVDGDEGEVRVVARRVGGVEVRVEDGDVEPPGVEDRGELEHGGDVALEWQREEDDASAAAAMLCLIGHRLWTADWVLECEVSGQ